MQNLNISSSLVAEKANINFLPKKLGVSGVVFESTVYSVMNELCREYEGGCWDFVELSNGGFFMKPNSEDSFNVSVAGNYYDGVMSSDEVGIVVCLFALSRLSFKVKDARIADYYYSLLDWADAHVNSREIFKAID